MQIVGIGTLFNPLMMPSKIRFRLPLVLGIVLTAVQLLAVEPAFAQNSPLPSGAANGALTGNLPTAADTVAAIQKIFKSRRTGGALLIAGSAVFIGTLSVLSSQESNSYASVDTKTIAQLATIGTSPAWILGIVKQVRFSVKREKSIVIQYQQTHRLPPFLQKIIARGWVTHKL